AVDPPPGKISESPLPGRPDSPGADGRWIVGETNVIVDARPAASLRVVLEVRSPAPTLPELQILGSARAADAREAPRLFVTRYAPSGKEWKLEETDDPYRPVGATLDAELRRTVVDGRGEEWRDVSTPDSELGVYV